MRSNMCCTVSKALAKSIYAMWTVVDRLGRKPNWSFEIRLLDCRKCIKQFDKMFSNSSDRIGKQHIGR